MVKSQNSSLTTLTHILGLFLGFLGPLIMLLASRDKLVQQHARVALNWQLSVLVYSIVSGILMFVLIGFLLMAVVGVVNLIFCIIAAVKANEGELWIYPFSIPFVPIR